MWELDHQKPECQRIEVFNLWCWKRQSLLDNKVIKPPKGNQPWIFIGRTDVEAETSILCPPDVRSWLIWKDHDWERLMAGGEGDDRGWDAWMASLTWWTWVWVDSVSWWWTGRPGVLQFMGSQSVGHDWTTELNWTEFRFLSFSLVCLYISQ